MSDKKKYPWSRAGKNDRSAAEGVYAGPEFFSRPPEPPVAATYAGPEFMNGGGGFAPPETPAPKPVEHSGEHCPCCGAPVSAESRFCSECGAVLK